MLFPTSGSFLVHQVIDISPRPTSGMYRGIAGGPTGILSAALPRNAGGEGVKLARPRAPERSSEHEATIPTSITPNPERSEPGKEPQGICGNNDTSQRIFNSPTANDWNWPRSHSILITS